MALYESNLEEVGLIRVGFPGLDELVSDQEEFAGNDRLAEASQDLRRDLFTILFDHMRRGLAIATEALDRGKILQALKARVSDSATLGQSIRMKKTSFAKPVF